MVVLEELEHAKQRGAKILAEVVGYGATGDAYHITSPAEDGSGAAKAMEWAVKEAGISTDDVWYVNAHGTSTHHNDLFETIAIKKTFGEQRKRNENKFYKIYYRTSSGSCRCSGSDHLCKRTSGRPDPSDCWL